MTKVEIVQRALTLPERERFELARILWASLEEPNAFQEHHPLPDWQKQLLDERLEASASEEAKTPCLTTPTGLHSTAQGKRSAALGRDSKVSPPAKRLCRFWLSRWRDRGRGRQ